MSATPRKRLRPIERRARILAAALTAFARDGYRAASMNEIAAAAGVTKPVLYDHFPSKQALFGGVLADVRAALLGRGEAATRLPLDAKGRFRAAVAGFFAFAEENPEATRVLLHVPRGDPEAEAMSAEIQSGASKAIAGLLARVLPHVDPWRLSAMAEFLKQGLHSLAEWKAGRPEVTDDDLVELVMDLVWTGLAAQSERGAQD